MNDFSNVEAVAQMLDNPNGAEIDMSDPKVMDLINKLSGDEPAAGDESGTNAPDTDEANGEAAAKAPEQANQQAKAEEPKKVLMSKDGKHEIPFDVLEQSRANEQAAIAAAQQLAAVVNALEAEIAASRARPADQQGQANQEAQQNVHPLRARLNAAREAVEESIKEYPDFAPAQKALLESQTMMAEQLFAIVEAQEEKLNRLEKVAVQQVQQKADAVRDVAKDALDQVPALVVWQSKNPDLFKLASTFDDTLKADPAWKGRPMAERFTKAVEMVVAVRGPSVLEGITTVQNTSKTGGKQNESLQAQAHERIAAALGITSLSDLPGGTAVSQESGSIEGLSDSQLVDKLAGMKDSKDIFAFMAGVGT